MKPKKQRPSEPKELESYSGSFMFVVTCCVFIASYMYVDLSKQNSTVETTITTNVEIPQKEETVLMVTNTSMVSEPIKQHVFRQTRSRRVHISDDEQVTVTRRVGLTRIDGPPPNPFE